MRRICPQFAAIQTSSRLYSAAAGTKRNSTKDQPSTNTYTTIYRKHERRKPADTVENYVNLKAFTSFFLNFVG